MYVLLSKKTGVDAERAGKVPYELWSVRIERRVQAVITAEGFYSKH